MNDKGTRARRVLLLILLIGIALGGVRLVRRGPSGVAIGGQGGEGCGGPPGAQPAVAGNTEQGGAAGARMGPRERLNTMPAHLTVAEQSALDRFSSARGVSSLPPALRPAAALAVDRIHSLPQTKDVDTDSIRIISIDGAGTGTSVRVRQEVNHVPVYDTRSTLLLDHDQNVVSLTGTLYPSLQLDTKPTVSVADAVARAIEAIGCHDCMPRASRRWLLVVPQSPAHLAWRVWPRVGKGGIETQPMVFIDAHSGEVLSTCARDTNPACFDENR